MRPYANRVLQRLRRFGACDAGTQLAELAIVLPIILVLFGATAEFGRFFYTYTTLAKATRAGARYLTAGNQANDADAKRLVVSGTTGDGASPILSGLSDGNVIITREGPTGYPETVKVEISGYQYEPIFDLGKLMGNSFSLNVDVKPSTTMRYINN
ncbi:MAG TPA: TadE family protein [Pyrinomonadaceae bacterium]|nr:TadE family protein [Pyrinomonadaceae bacterium]